ncbi:ABC transporter ATP-binding protein [Kineococcus gynurae]|uniref:ABC transporter ATP-binding protein n=1 Tax=Kineococcus gynurae TaxID=452979 RepID=UPI0035F020EF
MNPPTTAPPTTAPPTTAPSTGLELRDVTLTYADGSDRLLALDRVDLHVPGGTLAAVVGPSGSGKSSLLAVAATLVRPDSGTVSVAGRAVDGLSPRALSTLRRNDIGIVFQQSNLLAALTAAEQLEVMRHLGPSARREPRAAVRERARDLLEAVGLSAAAHRRPHQLSGGQRQRVNIARALMNDPAVLLVDEPTSALDHERGAGVVDLLARLTRRLGTATVLVTHDRAHLGAVDRVLELVDGRLAPTATAPVPVGGICT